MTDRFNIAAAATTVEGVEVSAYYQHVTEAGRGWVERTRTDYQQGIHPAYGAIPFWAVTIVMPQDDVAAAEEWIETYQQPLVEALSEAMAVTTATPQLITITDSPALKVLTINGHT